MARNQFGEKSIGESEWKPHNWNIATNPSAKTVPTTRVSGPDWSSSLRCVEQELRPVEDQKKRSEGKKQFPWKNDRSIEEWKFYWDGAKGGKRCEINGELKGNQQTTTEVLVEDGIGSRKKVFDPRGGVPYCSPGDKSYAVPEYSTDFHKEGSTLPAVNFGRSSGWITETFIPVQPLPRYASETYLVKESKRKTEEEWDEVRRLNEWTPAMPITPGL